MYYIMIGKKSNGELVSWTAENRDFDGLGAPDVSPQFITDVSVLSARIDGYSSSGGGGGITDHGFLSGLLDDDHKQYLLINGTRSLTGSLNFGGNNITNIGTIDGYTMSDLLNELNHGSLTNLGADDHTQYLLASGARSLSGNLNLGGNSLTNVNQLNGFNPNSHSSRHLSGGADPIDGYNIAVNFTPGEYNTPSSGLLGLHLHEIDKSLSSVFNVFETQEDPSGFPDRSTSSISVNDATRTFSIEPVSSEYNFIINGRVFTKTEINSIDFPNTEGLHYFWFDNTGTLQSSTTDSDFSAAIAGNAATVAALYWDSSNAKTILFAEERHGLMDNKAHIHFHNAFGAQWYSGGELQNITTNGSGNDAIHAQLSVEAVQYADEDIVFNTSTSSQQLNLPARIPIFYRSTNGYWRKKDADDYPMIYSGTAGYTGGGGRLPYNQDIGGGNWTLTEVPPDDYVLIHIFANNDINEPICGIQGQNFYGVTSDAIRGAQTEIANLTGMTELLSPEWVRLGTIICRTSIGANNVPKAAIIGTTSGEEYIDHRGNSRSTQSSSSDHGSLNGLLDDDHTQYLLSSGVRSMSGSLNMGTNSITNVNQINGYTVLELYNGPTVNHGDLAGLLDDDHTQYLLASGIRSMSGSLNMGSNNITNVNEIDGYTVLELFNGPGLTSDHGLLAGLGNDDHTQYLLANGTRSMSGSLNMGGFNITNVSQVDGRDVESLVSGPASSTNLAIAVWGGTTGKLISNSSVTLEAGGIMNFGLGQIRIGSLPSTTGAINLSNNQLIASRNAAGTDNYNLISSTASDRIAIGQSTNTLGIEVDGTTSHVFELNNVSKFTIADLVSTFNTDIDLNNNDISNVGTIDGYTVLELYNGPGSGGGSGDVVGPASATDNSIATFDSTTGKLIQSSIASVNDTGLGTFNGIMSNGDVTVINGFITGIQIGLHSITFNESVPHLLNAPTLQASSPSAGGTGILVDLVPGSKFTTGSISNGGNFVAQQYVFNGDGFYRIVWNIRIGDDICDYAVAYKVISGVPSVVKEGNIFSPPVGYTIQGSVTNGTDDYLEVTIQNSSGSASGAVRVFTNIMWEPNN